MRIENSSNKVFFTSAFRANLFLDGVPVQDKKLLQDGLGKVTNILFDKNSSNTKFLEIQQLFKKYVKDFNFMPNVKDKGKFLRKVVKDGAAFVFTGVHAERLNELGKMIGKVKSGAKAIYGTTKSQETSEILRNYFNKIDEFLSFPNIRVREKIDYSAQAYTGDELVCNIYAKSVGKKSTKNPRIEIEGVKFEKSEMNKPKIEQQSVDIPLNKSEQNTVNKSVEAKISKSEMEESKEVVEKIQTSPEGTSKPSRKKKSKDSFLQLRILF